MSDDTHSYEIVAGQEAAPDNGEPVEDKEVAGLLQCICDCGGKPGCPDGCAAKRGERCLAPFRRLSVCIESRCSSDCQPPSSGTGPRQDGEPPRAR